MSEVVVPLGTRRATLSLGKRLADDVRGGDLILLEGSLGAGKTFLARAIARALGVPREITVASPTFSLVHEYDARVPLSHADLYRLERASDVRELGLSEARLEGRAVIAEWAERFEAELGGDALVIRLEGDGDARRASLRATGARSRELLTAATKRAAHG